MPTPSRSEGETFVMGQAVSRDPMCAEDRFWLWFWCIVVVGLCTLIATISVSVIAYQKVTTPEQMCAMRADPPEFCRELAKRRLP